MEEVLGRLRGEREDFDVGREVEGEEEEEEEEEGEYCMGVLERLVVVLLPE